MSDILMRIQKLLELAKNSSNEHEAASAARRARAMMAEHEITEAEVRLAAGVQTSAEPIEKGHYVSLGTTKRVGWHWTLAYAIAQSYGAKPYWHGSEIGLFGRLSAVQATEYTLRYLVREVAHLADREAAKITAEGDGSPSRRWRNAFRLGAAERIAERLGELRTPVNGVSPRRGHARAVHGETEAIAAQPAPASVLPSAGAMVLIERDRKEVEDEYAAYSRKWGKVRGLGRASSGDGFRAGRAAGGRVPLSGARGALKRGTGVLP